MRNLIRDSRGSWVGRMFGARENENVGLWPDPNRLLPTDVLFIVQ